MQISKIKDKKIFEYNTLAEIGKYFIDSIIQCKTSCIVESEIIDVFKQYSRLGENVTQEKVNIEFARKLNIEVLPKDVYSTCAKKLKKLKTDYEDIIIKIDNIIEQTGKNINNEKDLKQRATKLFNEKRKLTIDIEQTLAKISEAEKKIRKSENYFNFLTEYKENIKKTFLHFENFEEIKLKSIGEEIALGYLYSQADVSEYFDFYNSFLDITQIQISDQNYIPLLIKYAPFINERKEKLLEYDRLITNSDNKREELECDLKQYCRFFSESKDFAMTDRVRYYNNLKWLISDEFISSLLQKISKIDKIAKRKDMICKIMALYNSKDFDTINFLIPSQIEGILYDFLIDVKIFDMATDKDMKSYSLLDLANKMQILKYDDDKISIEIAMYFTYFFNSIRNELAHGGNSYLDLEEPEKEIVSFELLLDLNCVIELFNSYSQESRFKAFIREINTIYLPHGYVGGNQTFGKLYNQLIERRININRFTVGFDDAMNILYWIFNPYFENKLTDIDDKSNLVKIREILKNCDFWTYVLEVLEREVEFKSEGILNALVEKKLHFFKRFNFIINIMFQVVNDDTKCQLRKINKLLKKYT
ncbi:hypothetical protein [Chryseobacterium sp.]|uniref:hypothetical protein n=1 Tax=Chryseobacterium sp. TaxID=1871047 RepID=UPI002FC88F73